ERLPIDVPAPAEDNHGDRPGGDQRRGKSHRAQAEPPRNAAECPHVDGYAENSGVPPYASRDGPDHAHEQDQSRTSPNDHVCEERQARCLSGQGDVRIGDLAVSPEPYGTQQERAAEESGGSAEKRSTEGDGAANRDPTQRDTFEDQGPIGVVD